MAHIRQKRQVPGNESQSGNVFEGIEKANGGTTQLISQLLPSSLLSF